MSFLSKIQDANQDIVSANSSEVYLMAKPKSSDNLETILTWVKAEGERISKDFKSFKTHVELLMSENNSFYNWVITNKQNTIAIECGISQGYTSKIFGPVQKDYKEKIRREITKQIREGAATEDIARKFDRNVRSIQRAKEEYAPKYYMKILSSGEESDPEEPDQASQPQQKISRQATVCEEQPVSEIDKIMKGRSARDLAEWILKLQFDIRQQEHQLTVQAQTIEQLKIN